MTVQVNVALQVRSATLDFTNNSIQLSFNMNKFGQLQTATLDAGQDFTPQQIASLQNSIEMLFSKWVSRQ